MAPVKNPQLLAKVNFPLLCVCSLTERHILVAGGGGCAKTGISNSFEIYELLNDLTTSRAEPIAHFDTGDTAIMNCTVIKTDQDFVLATGMDNCCQLYHLKKSRINKNNTTHSHEGNHIKDEKQPSQIRQRRKSNSISSETETITEDPVEDDKDDKKPTDIDNNNLNNFPMPLNFEVIPSHRVQTDYCKKDDPLQKVVKFCPALSILITAGTEGVVRVWKFPTMNQQYKVQAHQSEIADLDINPLATKFVTVTKDGQASVWNIKNGIKEKGLFFPPEPSSMEKYIFRNCRFGIVEGRKDQACLYTIMNPIPRQKPALPCYLCKWDSSFNLVKYIKTGKDWLSKLAISDDGRFLGVGTLEGAVDIYIAFSLQRIYHAPQSHKTFVTGLEFLKSSQESQNISGGYDASLISISVDNKINIHNVPQLPTTSFSSFFIGFVLTIIALFFILDYLNL